MTVDESMLQRCSIDILDRIRTKQKVSKTLLENWLTALIIVYKSGADIDENTLELMYNLESIYSRVSVNYGAYRGFNDGAIYGILKFYKLIKDL